MPEQVVPAGATYMLRVQKSAAVSREPHPFSCVSAGGTVDSVSFLVSQLGDYTKAMDQIKAGTAVYLEGPLGTLEDMVQAVPAEQPVFYVGMGVGIGPIISLVRSHAHPGENHVLYIARSEHHIAMTKELEEARQLGLLTSYFIAVGRDRGQEVLCNVDQALLQRSAVVVIGSSAAVLDIHDLLMSLGVDAANIIDERMTM